MSMRSVPRVLAAAVVLAGVAALAACMSPIREDPFAAEEASGGDDWVVVVYDAEDEFAGDLMDQLVDTELAADRALSEAGAGWIDGNEVGDHTYELYFVGDDSEEMWQALEPVFEAAPVEWTRVELHGGDEDAAPRVLTLD